MRGEVLFEKMTGISDEFIAEAALVAPAGVAAPKKKPFEALSRALNSGWGVACICLIAVAALLMGTSVVGRIATPVPEGTPPLARFSFTYEMKNSDGTPWDGTAMPGDWVCVDTSIVNRGLPFIYTGSSSSYHPDAYFVLQGNESVSMQCAFIETSDVGTHSVAMGEEGRGWAEITIPENATPGVYDLVLSYKGTVQVYKGVLTVGETAETFPPVEDGHPFSFGYEPFGGFAIPGDEITVNAWVINEGDPFTYIGNSYEETGRFFPTIVLYHMETEYVIKGQPPETAVEAIPHEVLTGQKGEETFVFLIPADAPTGAYAIRLSYFGEEQAYGHVLTVAVPTVIDPAVLYNLTMPIGSDWLYEPIDEAYVDGELVTVRIKFATDVGTLFFLNGEVIDATTGDDQLGYWEYNFIMPKKDSEIIFQTYDGMAPYGDILKAYYTANPMALNVLATDYGTYGDGVRVAILYDDRFAYTDMVSEQRIGPAVIRYADGNIMQVLHDGVFCSLAKAYEAGLLSNADLAALENLQREWNPHLYADDE